MKKIIGAVPTYLRPPYGSISNAGITAIAAQGVGITDIALWDVDAEDAIGATVEESKTIYWNIPPNTGSHNILNHEPVKSTAEELVPFMIAWAKSKGLRMVTVAECLGDSKPPYTQITTQEARDSSWHC